jgi:outer membrane protein
MKSFHFRLTKLNGLRFSFLAIAALIGLQVTLVVAGHAQTTPAIPPAIPSPTPTSSPPIELPQHGGTRNEIQPLIPAGQLPSPTPSPSPNGAGGNGEIVGGISQQQAEEFDRRFESALAVAKLAPPGLFSLSLLDAVRISLAQNKDLRLSSEDSQSAKGTLQQKVGDFDTTMLVIAKYAHSIPAEANNTALDNNQQVLSSALPSIFHSLGIPASSSTINSAITQAVQSQELKATDSIDTQISLSKKFRNGIDMSIQYQPIWVDQAGNNKYPPTTNRIVLTANIPLFKKAGVLYNDAEEIGARIGYESKLLTLRNQAQKTASDAAQAYWGMVAALEKFALQDRAYRVDALLADLSKQMAEGGGVPYSEVTLADGRRSQSFAQRTQALVSVYDAAKKLAITIGLRSDQLHRLPLAFQSFPTISEHQPRTLNSDALVDAALARRLDRAAALQTIRSKQVSLAKAKEDLTIAPSLTTGIGTDINNEKLTDSDGQSQRGTKLGLDLSLEAQLAWPFANNSSKGGVVLAQADLNQAVIQMEDLSTTIAANVTASADTIQELGSDVETQLKAVTAFRKSFDDMREKFRRGATTMFETIQSEEQLTTAETQLVDFRLALANAIVDLRYETATLLSQGTVLRVPGFPRGVEQANIAEEAFETVPDVKESVGPVLKDRNYEPNVKYISGRPPWHQ